jgi:peptidoglycan hydrolase-like protein with peptidoglycan-binding domain
MNVEPWSELTKGDEGSGIKGMQYLLRAHGASLTADGKFGQVTESAVREFQDDQGLPVDGIVGPKTWPHLVITTRRGDRGEAVKGVQSFGLALVPESDPLVVDGVFGRRTQERVQQFQNAWGLTEDGIAGSETWSYLVAEGEIWPLVKPGATQTSNFRVLPAQYLLRANGFDIAADGIYGPETAQSVRQFQTGLRAMFISDVLGSLDWPELVIEVGRGSTGDAVRGLQSVFPQLAVDGNFGSNTEAAVKDFQETFGLNVDGIAGRRTWRLLMIPKSE